MCICPVCEKEVGLVNSVDLHSSAGEVRVHATCFFDVADVPSPPSLRDSEYSEKARIRTEALNYWCFQMVKLAIEKKLI